MTSILSINSNIFSDIDFDYDDVLILSKLHPILQSKLCDLTTLRVEQITSIDDLVPYSRLRYLTLNGLPSSSSRIIIPEGILNLTLTQTIDHLFRFPSSLISLTIPVDLDVSVQNYIPQTVTNLSVQKVYKYMLPTHIISLTCTTIEQSDFHEGLLSLTILHMPTITRYLPDLPRSLTYLDAEYRELTEEFSCYPNLTVLKCRMSVDSLHYHLSTNPSLTSITNTLRQSHYVVTKYDCTDIVWSPLIQHLDLYCTYSTPINLTSLTVSYVLDPTLLPVTLQHLVIEELDIEMTIKLVNLLTLRITKKVINAMLFSTLPPHLTDLELYLDDGIYSDSPWKNLPSTLTKLKLTTPSEYKDLTPLPMLRSLTYIYSNTMRNIELDSSILPRNLTELIINTTSYGTVKIYNNDKLPSQLLSLSIPSHNTGPFPKYTKLIYNHPVTPW